MLLCLVFAARNFFNAFREDHEMMHLRDLQKLEGVLTPTHLEVCCSLKSYVELKFLLGVGLIVSFK